MNVKDRRFRIAMLSVHSSPLGKLGSQDTGGMSVYIRELARQLGRIGQRVDIYTRFEKKHQDKEVSLSENVRLIRLDMGDNGPVPKDSLVNYLPLFFDSMESYRSRHHLCYDLIHSHYWLSGRVGVVAQRKWNVPHLVTFHTTGMAKKISCGNENESRFRLIAEKKLAHECDRIIAPTKREKALLSRYYSIPSGKIGLVPCGVNLGRFHPVPQDQARRQLGLEKSGPLILYVGRFAPVKGIERLIDAMIYLRSNYPDLVLMIIGGDGHASSSFHALSRKARKLGIHGSVKFEGRILHDKLPFYYSAADVLAVPSYYESFGLVALESLACGTPVVASRVGAMDSLVQRGKTGAIVDFPGPQRIAHAIDEVIMMLARGLISQESVRGSVMGHGWQKIASAILSEYLAVIQSNGSSTANFRRELGIACGIKY